MNQPPSTDEPRPGAPTVAEAAELLAPHRERLRRTVLLRLDRRVLARLDVSDVVQEVMLEAVRRLRAGGRTEMPMDLWLAWLAREKVLALHRQHLRADCRAVGHEAAPLPVDSSACFVQALVSRGPSPSQTVAAAEAAERLRVALGKLDDDERDVVLWRHFEQLSNRKIARLLGISEAAAGKRYIRALERLRGLLEGAGVSGQP
jgi:RNA polymerase sigma-70 factor (ECF subfamily)